jgi:Fe-S cluster assembly ATP-binding protein
MLVTQEFSVKVDDKTILDNVHIEFGPGIHVLMGPNGVGKSSFANALMGHFNYETTGAVEFYGKDLLALETFERARAGLFVGFQSPSPVPGLSNFQFIKQAKQSNGEAPNIRDDLFEFRALTNRFGLDSEWDKRQVNVDSSGGEKKKNELIQMLMLNPKCAILDEPDSGLDVDGIKLLTEKLNEYIESDPTKVLIIVTHYEKLIEDLNVSSVSIMKDANIKQHEGKDIAYQIFKEGFANV